MEATVTLTFDTDAIDADDAAIQFVEWLAHSDELTVRCFMGGSEQSIDIEVQV